MKCDCKDWEENMSKIDHAFHFREIHGMSGYEGKLFSHCPWCGEELIDTV